MFALFAALRLAVGLFFLLTASFGIVCASPFAYDQFIRARLVPSVNAFVDWHHLWYLAAYLASVVTLIPELDWRRPRSGRARAAHALAIAYVVSGGAAGVWLLGSPYLPLLTDDRRSLVVGLVSFLPLIWLAVIDHLAAPSGWLSRDGSAQPTTGQRRLFFASMLSAVFLWALHVAHALWQQHGSGGIDRWLITSLWTLALTGAIFLIAFALLALVSALAERTSRPRVVEYAAIAVIVAVAIAEFVRRVVLPTILLDPVASALASYAVGISLSAAWSGLALRRPPPLSPPSGAVAVLLPAAPNRRMAILSLVIVSAAALFALAAVERIDWNSVAQRIIVVAEWGLVFGLMLSAVEAADERRWDPRRPLAALALIVAALFGIPRLALTLADRTHNPSLEPNQLLPRHATAETAFNLISRALTASSGQDAEYYRFLQLNVAAAGTVPTTELSPRLSATEAPRPDIFLFVIDSLRRDYLSPYNDAVTFTPAIEQLARDSFVFRNAFTRHGGTQLAMPSIWSGAFGVRAVGSEFRRMNALEKLLNADGYRLLINDHTVDTLLRPARPMTVIDPDVASKNVDLCSNLRGLTAQLDAPVREAGPRFTFLSPMNVHIMNTRVDGQPPPVDRTYPGFYDPYASRLQRIDACLGTFIADLKAKGRYDNSIVIVTSDHGDSLGEDGFWGHAFWLFPEIVRVPLIVHLPERLARDVTTDLGRLTFSTDIAPSLYALLGHEVRSPGPLFGSPLFVPSSSAPPDRRRDSFLLTSSYGQTFALLRRNGRLLYVSDLGEQREFAFDLSRGPIGHPVPIDGNMQRVNQRIIREQLAEVGRFYQVKLR